MEENFQSKSRSRSFSFKPLSQGIGLGALDPSPDSKEASESHSPPKPQINPEWNKDFESFDREKRASFARRLYLPWRFRVLAHALDLLITLVFCMMILSLISFMTSSSLLGHLGLWATTEKISQAMLFVYGVYLLYVLVFKFLVGRTLGFLLIGNRRRTPF